LGGIVLLVILAYNKLVSLRNQTENAWSQIDVQLKRRYDLIPNLVSAVKGYMKHEKGVLEKVTELRSGLIKGDVNSKEKTNNMLSSALKSIFAVAEDYPKLMASTNFLNLQEELSATESKISYARQFYNDAVYNLNTATQSFPTNIIASVFNFSEKEYFGIEETARKPVKVEF
jgi:LemA protein